MNREIKFKGKSVENINFTGNHWFEKINTGVIYHVVINKNDTVFGSLIIRDKQFYVLAHVEVKSPDGNIIEKEYFEVEVIPETVGQYTRLHDKNEVEIYEGDIVKLSYNKHYWIRTIESIKTSALYFIEQYDNCSRDDETDEYTYEISSKNKGCWRTIDFTDTRELTIIGNIHDNPELLQSGDNPEPEIDTEEWKDQEQQEARYKRELNVDRAKDMEREGQ